MTTFKSLQQNREKMFDEQFKGFTIGILSNPEDEKSPVFTNNKLEIPRLKSFHASSMKAVLEWVVGEIENVNAKLLKKARILDYADRTEYDEAVDMVTSLKSRLEESIKEI